MRSFPSASARSTKIATTTWQQRRQIISIIRLKQQLSEHWEAATTIINHGNRQLTPGGRGSLQQCFGSLPSQQSEIQRLKAENKMLATRLQSAKAMEKHYYESWIGTFPQFKSLRTQIEELKKILEENRQVEEVSEDGNEFLTTKFGIRRNRVLPKGTFGVPAVTAVSCSYPNLINCLTCRPGNFYTRNPRKAHHHVQVQNTGQPRNNQLILLGRLRLPFTRLHSRQHILSEKGILRLIHPSPQCVQL